MATTKWITLRNSIQQAAYVANPNVETGKKFLVIAGGYKPILVKAQSQQRALDGTLDLHVGGIYKIFKYAIRTSHTLSGFEGDPNAGTLSDLDALYMLNKPNPTSGQPSNLIYLVDHYGTTYSGFLTGEHSPEPITTIIDGTEAHFIIPIEFTVKDAVA